jgi:hypothetical protein
VDFSLAEPFVGTVEIAQQLVGEKHLRRRRLVFGQKPLEKVASRFAIAPLGDRERLDSKVLRATTPPSASETSFELGLSRTRPIARAIPVVSCCHTIGDDSPRWSRRPRSHLENSRMTDCRAECRAVPPLLKKSLLTG